MKTEAPTALLLLCGLLLCGCSRTPEGAPLVPELVQEGKTVTWPDGRNIYVARRQGNTLAGVRVVQKCLAGPERTVEAERGLISKDPDGRTVRVTLRDAVFRHGDAPGGTLKEFSVICRE
ncbi:MAG TPA: hypothetical protein VNZ64_01825 [Candidatus Acidoferrum sp.]|nr:hypothetical protein [Candidatus Acidoferrum sp.]